MLKGNMEVVWAVPPSSPGGQRGWGTGQASLPLPEKLCLDEAVT